jgi:hypothetical protein
MADHAKKSDDHLKHPQIKKKELTNDTSYHLHHPQIKGPKGPKMPPMKKEKK